MLKFIPSCVPGWYDPTWPGFPKDKKDWTGCRVRVHFKVPAGSGQGDYDRELKKAYAEAEQRFVGAQITAVADVEDDSGTTSYNLARDSTDLVKIRSYVRETLPEKLKQDESRIITYLASRLAGISGSGLRTGGGVIFDRAVATNFLSFKKVTIDFDKAGIVIVQGRNRDKGGSNGAGKTNYLQLIPVALFGQTFKGQKHNRWARRGCKDESRVAVRFRLQENDKRLVEIVRSRNPNKLQLEINDVDQSSGLRSDARTGTQGQIESISGYTWQTLANAIYIDQSIARAFISGTKSERTALLSRFQNLERFEEALRTVKADRDKLERARADGEHACGLIQSQIDSTRSALKVAKEASELRIGVVRKEFHLLQVKYKKVLKHYKRHHREREWLRDTHEIQFKKANKVAAEAEEKLSALEYQRKELDDWLMDAQHLHRDTKCPTCNQKLNHERLSQIIRHRSHTLTELKKRIVKATRYKINTARLAAQIEADHDKTAMEDAAENGRLLQLQQRLEEAEFRYLNSKNANWQESIDISTHRRTLRTLKTKRKALNRYFDTLIHKAAFYAYCCEAFSRDGIPAYLNAQLCPVLNKAAEHYAELFADKSIQVRFDIVEGEFEPQVINAHGGVGVDDQSAGEKALAGLIASFALREIAPKSNILILDEPGAGLDPESARKFAEGLQTIARDFGTVFITTFDKEILQGLAGEKIVTIEKIRGRSYVS